MSIDIDRLSEAELVDLNHRVVERLRFIRQARAHHTMLQFKIGERVYFEPEGRGRIEGMVVRYNKKTVTVISSEGQPWRVSPGLLHRLQSSFEGEAVEVPQLPLLPR
jgi:hypothetical protein